MGAVVYLNVAIIGMMAFAALHYFLMWWWSRRERVRVPVAARRA